MDGVFYPFSSIIFYDDSTVLLLNGRFNNREYGSDAPAAPRVFIDDRQFMQLWSGNARCYLVTEGTGVEVLTRLVGSGQLHTVAESGGKSLSPNHALSPLAASFPAGPQNDAGGREIRHSW